jgi:hypothetical protein
MRAGDRAETSLLRHVWCVNLKFSVMSRMVASWPISAENRFDAEQVLCCHWIAGLMVLDFLVID